MSSSFYHPKYEYEARHVFGLNGRPFLYTFVAKHETLLFTHVNEEAPVANNLCIKTGMVANDLFIKANFRCGSVKQSSLSVLVCLGIHSISGAQ